MKVILYNSNFHSWSYAVKALLIWDQLWKFVDPGIVLNPITEVWMNGDEKALAAIQLTLYESQFCIDGEIDMGSVKGALQQGLASTKVISRSQIRTMYRVGESMEAYLAEIMKNVRLEYSGFQMLGCSYSSWTTRLLQYLDDDLRSCQ